MKQQSVSFGEGLAYRRVHCLFQSIIEFVCPMTGKVRSIRVLKQSVVVGFPDGTEAEVPLSQLTWEGREHLKAEPGRP